MFDKIKISFCFIVIILSLLLTIFLLPSRHSAFNDDLIFILSIIVFVNSVIILFYIQSIFKNWFRFDTLFILGFLIVHFQIPFFTSIGFEPENSHRIWPNKYVVNYGTWFSTVSILLWFLGYVLFLSRKKNISNRQSNAIRKYKVKHNKISLILLISFILFISTVGVDFLSGNYTGTRNWSTTSIYSFIFLRITLYLSIIYFFINNSGKLNSFSGIVSALSNNKITVFISIFYVLIFLWVGDRGPVMQAGLIILVGFSIYQYKIGLIKLSAILIFGAIIFNILALGRTREVHFRTGNIFEVGIENYKKNNVETPMGSTLELASSVKILYRSLDYVPDYHPYLNGTTLFLGIVDVIPFGGSLSIQAFNIPTFYTSSSTFFTALEKGVDYDSGDGSEILADLYVNVGVFGTFIIMFSFGYFIAFVTYNALINKNHVHIIIYISLVAVAVYLNRAQLLFPLKTIVWMILLDKYFVNRIKIDE